jgi:hypothetical protein
VAKKTAPPISNGGLIDGVGGKSSKRLGSLVGLGAALVFPLLVALLKLNLPVVELTIAFLTYSAALQGVSTIAEKK